MAQDNDGSAGEPRPPRKGLIPVLVLAAAVRLLLPLAAAWHSGGPGVFCEADSASYVASAESLARSGSFRSEGAPELLRTPGYPLLLVPGVWLGAVEWVTVLLQAALGVLTVYLVWRLAEMLFAPGGPAAPSPGSAAEATARRIPLFAALVYALDPLSVVHCSLLMSETLFAALLALHLFLLLRFIGSGAWGHLTGAALLAAAATYVRPIGYYLPLAEAAILLTAWFWRRRARRAAPAAAGGPGFGAPSPGRVLAFLVLAIAPLIPWQIRNKMEADYGGFSAVVDQNLYFFQAAAVTAAVENRPLDEIRGRLEQESAGWATTADRAGHYRALGAAGRRVLREHPFVYARIHLTGMAQLLVGPGSSAFLRLFGASPKEVAVAGGEEPRPSWLQLPLGLILLAQLALAALPIFRRRFGAALPAAVLLGVAAYVIFASGGALPYSRFRHPLMPVICVFAGLGLAAIAGARARRLGPCPGSGGGKKGDS